MNRFFTILSMAAVVFAACDKENETPGQKIDPAELVEVTFDVSAKTNQSAEVQNVSTKTEIKEDGTVLWSVGDKVSVFYEVNGETGSSESEALTAENIKADGSASITVKVPAAFTLEQFEGTRSLTAVYPFDASAAYVDGKINVSAPEVQDGTFAHASLSVAEWTGSNSLVFENQCGLLRIEAEDAAVSKITLKSADADIVTLNVSGAGTYYAAVAPSTLEGFSVVLTDAEGEELAKKVSAKSLVVEKGHVLPLGKVVGFDDRFYVSAEAKGRKDGSNWDNAAGLTELKGLLAKGVVMNVYMSAGTYSVTDALVSEADGADFSVYGGYPAGAKGASLKARDAKSNATIFDGGGKSQIWLTKKGNVLFEGLTFQNGFSAKDNGGALVFNGTGVTGKILDCSFIGNKVTDGTNGTQYLSGGAIHVFEAKVTVENSSFSKNYGRNGGSLFTNNAKAELTVKGCTFTEDYALNTGGSINNSNGTQMIENCTFTGCYNLDGAGGAIHINGASAVQTLKNCVFNACEANRNNSYLKVDNKACGGAISVQNANLDISGCTFDGNMGSAGSAMLLQSGDGLVRVTDCVFKNNKGASRGLIQTNGKAVLFMNNCQIYDNTMRTNQWGTVIHGGNPSVVCMNNCSIHNNVSQQAGGTSVCLNNDGFTVVVNTTVVGVNAKSLCRSNNSNGLFSLYDNCLLANKLDNGIVFFKEKNSSVKLNHDIIGPKATDTDGAWLVKTNVVVDGELSFCNGSSFDSSKGYWKWNGPSASFTKTTESAIVDRIKALDSNNGNTRLNGAFAPKFVEWVESLGGFNKDQLGTTRTTSGTWPGSVELK
ncbi:MAG: right-handed parallel beta-helix repeat-containing protein [Candidatus Cryptobacteroides sp.]|nr:right-handed parallel beta-helix repeat-containing protein [Candidatus Cryptobacteroides sp.]